LVEYKRIGNIKSGYANEKKKCALHPKLFSAENFADVDLRSLRLRIFILTHNGRLRVKPFDKEESQPFL
jgi:hypothetical protein